MSARRDSYHARFIAFVVGCSSLIIAAPLGASADMKSMSASSGYCSMPLVRNYEAPLRLLPPVRQPPIGKPLPFGPKSIVILRDGADLQGRVVVGGGRFGYMFSPRPGARSHHLNWAATASLFSLTERGFVKSRIRRTTALFGSTREEPDISLTVPSQAGFFRVDTEIKGEGKLLGKFSEYLRVVDPVLNVRLGTSRSTYRPGETLIARVENAGTETVGYGAGYSIDRLTDAGWIRVGPDTTIWPKYAAGLGVGGAGKCMKYVIPSNFPAGRYRIAKAITGGPLDSGAEELLYYSEFELVP